jgi:hypothetical protein
MLVRRHRLAIAVVITAAAIAVPTAALASGSGSPSGKPAPPQACTASACKSKASHAAAIKSAARSQLAALAASAGISTDRLQAGLVAAKRAGGNTAAGIAAFAKSTGVSHATAQRVVYAVSGTQVIKHSLTGPPAAVRALATRLGVAVSAAGRAFKQIGALSSKNGVDPASPAFAAIAHDLGVSPAQLAAAWDAVKPGVAGK